MKRKLLLLLCVMIILTVVGAIIAIAINPKTETSVNQEGKKIQVVTTFYPMYIIGLNIIDGIDSIELKNLTSKNTGCLHDYQLTTEDMKILASADVLIMNGGGMENFIEDIIKNYPQLLVIDASKGITMLKRETDLLAQTEGDFNSHVWLDPKLYINQIENVRDGLTSYLDSMGLDEEDIPKSILNNAQTYIQKVSDLDREIEESLLPMTNMSDLAGRKKEAVIFHDAFAYLASRIGLTVAYTVQMGTDTTLSAGEIADVIDLVKKDKIKYLFTELQYSDSIAKRIEDETDASVYVIDSIVTGDGSKDSYLNAMHQNILVLQDALQ